MRTGVIAKKVGMTRLFQEDGRHVPVTVLALEGCQVVAQRTDRTGTATSPSSSARAKQAKNISKPQRGHFAKARSSPSARSPSSASTRGRPDRRRRRDHRRPLRRRPEGRRHGVTVGKGFQGAMKRWGFGGMRATHGVSVSPPLARLDRPAPGSGQGLQEQEDGRPHGRRKPHPLNLEIVRVDAERGLIFVKGAVPGTEGDLAEDPRRGEAAGAEGAPFPAPSRKKGAQAPSTRKRRPARSKRAAEHAGQPRPPSGQAALPKSSRPAPRPRPAAEAATETEAEGTPKRRKQGGLSHEARGPETRRQGTGGVDRAPRRDLRHRGSAPTSCSACVTWQLAKRRAGTAQDPGAQRGLPHRQEDVQAEGHRQRPSRLAPGGPSSSAAARPTAPVVRSHDFDLAQEGPRAGPAARAVVQGQGRRLMVVDSARAQGRQDRGAAATFGKIGVTATPW